MIRSLTLPAAALLALAQAAPSLADVNIYSERQPELIQPVYDAFTAETGIKINSLYADKGLIERMVAEGRRSPADIYLTADIGNIVAAVDAGVTQAVDSPTLRDRIPAEYRDPDGHWFAPTTRARVIYASKERVDPLEITTYEDLASPKWKGRICTRSGTHPYNLALTAAYIAHHGEDAARAWLEGLKANLARKPQGNDRAQAKAVWAGECDIAIGNTYYVGKMLEDPEQRAWAESINVVFPVFEGGGTHVNVSGMSLTAAAPDRDEAVKFMEFLASREAQRIYAEANYEFPVSPDVPRSDVVASWGTFTPDNLPLSKIAELRGAALRLMEEVGFDE